MSTNRLERREWMKLGACWHCGRRAGFYRSIVSAHIKNGGASRKADASDTVRLCETPGKNGCHDAQHQHGWSVLDSLATHDQRIAAAAETEREWQAYFTADLSHHGAEQ